MANKFLHTFKQTAIYGIGNISTKLIGFILLPIYTNPKYLSTAEYGIWAMLEVTSQILIGVIALNLPLAMLRWASSEKKIEKQKSIIFTAIVGTILIALIALAFLLPSNVFFSKIIFGTDKFAEYFTLLFVVVALGIYNGIPLNIIRIEEKSIFYVSITTIKFLIVLLFNIYFVVYQHESVEGIIKGQLLGEVFIALSTLLFALKSAKPKFDNLIFLEMLKYGMPLVFSAIATFAIAFGDRYILLHFLNEAKVGIYSLGYKVAGIINMLILQSFQLGFLPIAYKKLGEKDEKPFFSKVLTYYAIVLVFAALGVSIFGKEILEIFAKSDDYFLAASVIPVIAFAFALKGVQYNFALVFHYTKKTYINAVIVVVSAVFDIVLNFALIPRFGIMGAAYSMFASILFMAIVSLFLGRKIYPIPFEKSKIVKIVFSGIFLFTVSKLFSDATFFIRILLKSSLIILFPLIAVFLKILDEQEIKAIKTYFASLLKLNRK